MAVAGDGAAAGGCERPSRETRGALPPPLRGAGSDLTDGRRVPTPLPRQETRTARAPGNATNTARQLPDLSSPPTRPHRHTARRKRPAETPRPGFPHHRDAAGAIRHHGKRRRPRALRPQGRARTHPLRAPFKKPQGRHGNAKPARAVTLRAGSARSRHPPSRAHGVAGGRDRGRGLRRQYPPSPQPSRRTSAWRPTRIHRRSSRRTAPRPRLGGQVRVRPDFQSDRHEGCPARDAPPHRSRRAAGGAFPLRSALLRRGRATNSY